MMTKLIYCFALLLLSVVCVNASHFRGAIFTWIPSEDGSAITIRFRISWRRTFLGNWCNEATIENRSLIGAGNLACSSGCTGAVGSLQYQCTDYSDIDDWTTGRHNVKYTVTSRAFSFSFSSCCWISTLRVGADGSWAVQATVDMSVRSDTGRINSSPTVELPPILNLQHGCSYNIHLPVGDVDGDIIRCRGATGPECLGACNGFVGAILNQDTCTITYTANYGTGLFPAALQVEDFASIISTTALSSIPLQFIVRVYSGTNCNDIPEFIQPTPEDNECFALDVGDNFNVTIKARGSHVITSILRCISLPVSVTGPTPLRVERVGLTNKWIIVIDQTFTRPSEPAYIKVLETSTNTEIISVDVSNSTDVVFDPIRRRINVTFQYVFDIEEDYHVSLPSGLVEGYVSCGALSVPIDDPGFWKIEVDCGEHSILNGVVSAPNGTDYPHSVTYMCNIGHDLIGAENRTCTANGTWTDNEPHCKPRDCGNFTVPVNGYVSTNSTLYNTTVYFSCNIGYKVSGNSSMYCDHTPSWSSSPPACVIIDCGNVTAPKLGDVTFTSTFYLDEAVFTCNTGYDLFGDAVVTCQSDDTWSDNGHICALKVCGFPDTPENGIMKASAATYQNIATFDCNEGFDVIGSDTLICTLDGIWNGSAPTCRIKDCGKLLQPRNGELFVNKTTFGSQAFYSCNTGFTLNGAERRACLSNATWSDSDPFCKIKDCGPPAAPENGQVSFYNTTYSSECVFSCSPGYYLSGVNISYCSENGSWNNSGTECIIKDCGNLSVPENGHLDSNTTTYGSVAVFSCMRGFTLHGDTNRRCTEPGLWDNEYPECLETNCGNLTDPVNGKVLYLKTTYQSTANYSCMVGYNLHGQNVTQCTVTGEWSQVQPSCKIIDCGALPAPINGNNDVNITTYGEVVNFSCDIGYTLLGSAERTCLETGFWSGTTTTCKIKDCGVLTAPEDGTIDISTTLYQSKVTYECSSGFDLVGVSSRECLSNGSWSKEAPTCLIKDCGLLDDIENGRVYLPFSTFGSVASYICNKGYHINGDVTRLCQADGVWDGEKPLCKLTVCPEIAPPEHGNVDYNSTLYEDEMVFSCNTGFILFGEELVVCQKDGTWSGDEHNCTIKDCGQLLAPTNGSILVTSTTYLSTLEFQCNEGYDLLGESSLVCRDDGFWNGTTPVCKIRECKSLKAPDHGSISSAGITFKSRATYSCDTGYNLVGTQNRTCLGDRNWSSSAPECQINDCGVPLIPRNGNVEYQNTTFGSYSYYNCSPGYDLIGRNVTFCTEFGNWSNKEIKCTIKDCGSLSVPPNAELVLNLTTYGSKASFSCKVGYTMHGSPERHCTEDGYWNNTSPTCPIKDCGSLSDPVNGLVYVPITTYNAYALYVCFDGYHIEGTHTRKCMLNGSWSSKMPTCEQTDCGSPSQLENGEVSFNGTVYGSEAKYYCYTGYKLEGDESVVCEEDEDWSDAGQTCMIRDCGPLEAPEDGYMKGSATTYQSVVTFSCSEGFDLIGNEVLFCTDTGFWNGSSPSCRIRDCGSLPALNDGTIIMNTTTFKSNAIYICNAGYSVIGPDIRMCLGNASWSGADPVCQIKDCHTPPVTSNAEVHFDYTTFGSISFYLCDVGYYMNGNNVSVCAEDGQWNNTEIECVLKDCGNLTTPENAQLLINNTYYGSLAVYSCNIGFVRHGDRTRTCLDSGNWSNEKPECVIEDCGKLSGIANGRVYLPSTSYGAVASYICNDGYYVSGDVTRVCQADGIWDGNEPSCELTDCEQLPNPLNGRIIANSRNFGDIALYICDPGYRLIGNNTRECLTNTTWTNTEPVCEIKDCEPLTHPENGHAHYKTTTFGSDVSVACKEGFDLIGEAEGTCKHSGNWSIDIPECRIKDCGALQNPENGVVMPEGTVYKSEASVVCNTGYYPDVEILHCTHAGKWDGNPMCIVEDCGLLEAPEHGSVSFSSTNYTSVAVFECDTGYDLIGPSNKTCQQDGTWTDNGQQATCTIRSCKYPDVPENGLVSVHSVEYKSVVTFSCDAGYVLVGNEELNCLENGIWDGLEPFCEIKDCNDPASITHGRLQFNTTTFGSVASYTCDSGYIMIGQTTIECLSHGIWEKRPMCKIKKCEQLQSPENGRVFVSANTYGALAIFSCNDGYNRIGSQLSECLENSAWSNTETRCEIKECGIPLLPTNGNVTYYNTTYQSVARYSCKKGHKLKGEELVTCNSDGLWNESIPECILIDCNDLAAPANGNVSVQAVTYGATAVVSCAAGYDLVGEKYLKCTESGQWSDDLPTCKIKDCGLVGNLTNGEVSSGTTVYGAIKTFTCDNGYEISGSNVSKCLANGSWSDTPPQCKFTATSSYSSLAHWIIGGSTGFIILLIAICMIMVILSRIRRNKRKSDYGDSTQLVNIKRINSWQNFSYSAMNMNKSPSRKMNRSSGTSYQQSDCGSHALRMTPSYLPRISHMYNRLERENGEGYWSTDKTKV